MRYYKGYIALSETCDVPVLLHVRNSRAICFDQLRELLSREMLAAIVRSLRWRVTRLEKVGLIARLNGQRFLGKPVYGITQQGLECLESRGHYLVSLPSDTEQILHPSKVAHALELVNIRLALARSGLLRSWKSDVEITSRNLVAANGTTKDYDAVAAIEVDGCTRSIGIEYERSAKSASRYDAIREALDRDKTSDTVLYLTASDDILYLLAMELRATRRRIGFALSETFRHSLLETRTLTNTESSEIVPFRELLGLRNP
ncbi:MAG TPA: hypothetical protein VK574_02515 [Terracidiphilus sp.]|nr:hypothetical protein [Terracidiphilus sp.]